MFQSPIYGSRTIKKNFKDIDNHDNHVYNDSKETHRKERGMKT